MDQSRAEGVSKKVSGSLKEAIGKVTGDAQTQAEGTAEKVSGRVENAVGGAEDAAPNLTNG